MKSKLMLAALCASSLVLSGCASKYVEPDQYSGFLKNYSILKEEKSPSGADVMRWVEPGLNGNSFTSVYLEPSQLYPQPQATEQVPQSTLQGVTQYYDQALKREVSNELLLVSTPGQGTLIVRPAITSVTAKTEGLKPYEVIPIALIVAGITTATGHRDMDTDIATEAAFLDGGSGKLVAEVVRKGTGTELENSSQVMTAKDAKPVLDAWASDLAKSIRAIQNVQ